jgi:hypothetical protein
MALAGTFDTTVPCYNGHLGLGTQVTVISRCDCIPPRGASINTDISTEVSRTSDANSKTEQLTSSHASSLHHSKDKYKV